VNSRLADQENCLDKIAEVALKEKVHAAILAGDIYHKKNPSAIEEEVFARFVAKLLRAGIYVFAVAGNHERPANPEIPSPLTHIRTLEVGRFHLFSEPDVITIEIGGEKLSVAGIPWLLRRDLLEEGLAKSGDSISGRVWNALAEKTVEKLLPKIPKDSLAILTAHIWTANARVIESNPYGEPMCAAQTIAREPFKYIALGHIHAHQAVWHDPPAVYPGAIDRNGFDEATSPKGAVIVTLDKNETKWEFFETPARKFTKIQMDLTGFENPTDAAIAKARGHNIADAIVEIAVKQGTDDIPIETFKIRSELSEAYFVRVSAIRPEKESGKIEFVSPDPLKALAEFIDREKSYSKDKEKLLELANRLADETKRS
jgi:exonuclease SbcD